MNLKQAPEAGAIAIVDAYQSGAEFAKVLERRGRLVAHVKSSPAITAPFLEYFAKESFSVDLGFQANPRELVKKLRDLEVANVVAGTESGVALAEDLSRQLELYSNEGEQPEIRYQRGAMMAAARNAGLKVPEGQQVTQLDEALAWAEQHGKWPVVVKPCRTIGSDRVRICEDADALAQAVEAMKTGRTQLGIKIDDFIVEEFLSGEEIIIDGVRGYEKTIVNYVCCSIKMSSDQGHPLYDRIELVDPQSAQSQQAIEFAQKALDALGIEFGAFHTEILMTSEGPALVKAVPRLSGAGLPKLLADSVNQDILECYADLLCDKAAFEARAECAPALKSHCTIAYLHFEEGGKLAREPRLREFGRFRSDAQLIWAPKVGRRVEPTEDLYSSPGHVVMRSEDPERIVGDLKTLRGAEKKVLAGAF